MTLLFSAATGGFYDSSINPSIPADAVQISEQEKAVVMAELSAGKLLSSDSNGKPVAVDPAPPTLEQVRAQQIGMLASAYVAAIALPVSFTNHSSVAKTFQASPQSIANLSQMILACMGAQAVPSGFYWVAADNTQVPFTYADMQGLAAAMGAQGFAAFAHLQLQKAAVLAAQTVAAVQAIVW